MANKTPDTTHLGKAHSKDPIASASATGTHFGGNTQHNRITETPDSKPSASDGKLGGDNSPDGRQGWAPINPAAKPNTYTGKGGSKRD